MGLVQPYLWLSVLIQGVQLYYSATTAQRPFFGGGGEDFFSAVYSTAVAKDYRYTLHENKNKIKHDALVEHFQQEVGQNRLSFKE